MTLRLTPDVLRTAYDFLRVTMPFKGWKLPPGEEVEFIVSLDRHTIGTHTTYQWRPQEHVIGVSQHGVGHTSTLIKIMAHEMVHAAQVQAGGPNTHNFDFGQRAKLVCRHHGFDLKEF